MDKHGVDETMAAPSGSPAEAITRRRAAQLLGVAALASLAVEAMPATAKRKRKRRKGARGEGHGDGGGNGTKTLFRDDFHEGFDAVSGSGNWFYFSAGPFVGNDGEETTSSHGLRVSAPRFTSTVPQESDGASLPGGFDHVKWLAYANRFAGAVPGFAAEAGHELSVSARVSARTFGTAGHPFGNAVADDEDDLRLAGAALNGVDLESWMVFDIFLTNKRLYAIYERLPFGRPQLGNYAAFTFLIPLGSRKPGDRHDLSTIYDRAAGTVRWLVDGTERFQVDRIGHRIDRKFLSIDHGGDEEDVAPKQLDFGMGMFTLLDGRLPSGKALVQLSNAPGFYYDPVQGEPEPQIFVDAQSAPGSRLFGQGAELSVERFTIVSSKANERH